MKVTKRVCGAWLIRTSGRELKIAPVKAFTLWCETVTVARTIFIRRNNCRRCKQTTIKTENILQKSKKPEVDY